MKKLFSFIAIVSIILASNCSRIQDNDDPIIGIWTSLATLTNSETGKITTQYEWIFNDAYLGRFHVKENGNVVAKTDFSWQQVDGLYIISYPGMDKEDDKVSLKDSEERSTLEDNKGNVLAIRE